LRNIFAGKNFYIAGLIFILLLFSVTGTSAAESKTPLVRIAVVPFQSLLPELGAGNSVVCPLSGSVYVSGKIDKEAEDIVREIFINKMKEMKDVEIIPLEKVEGVCRRVNSESLKMTLTEKFKKTGAELGADVVAVGYVFRYTERIGYHYSAEKPASVAFEISLIKAADGKLIWRGAFDKTQKSLMEDLFEIASFYKGGGKWLSASELTKQGIDQIFKSFSGFEH
jgi:hypothetical protein